MPVLVPAPLLLSSLLLDLQLWLLLLLLYWPT